VREVFFQSVFTPGNCVILEERQRTSQTQRRASQFPIWLTQAERSTVAELRRFAAGLHQEYHPSMAAALEYPWSNGPVEGHVNRLKTIKRQMYGRANFDLLKARVLHAA